MVAKCRVAEIWSGAGAERFSDGGGTGHAEALCPDGRAVASVSTYDCEHLV